MSPSTMRPDHVQVFQLYKELAGKSGTGRPTIDSTQITFDLLTLEFTLKKQGIPKEDIPAALESLVSQGMMRAVDRSKEFPYEPGNLVPGHIQYAFTHKAAALYHSMQQD